MITRWTLSREQRPPVFRPGQVLLRRASGLATAPAAGILSELRGRPKVNTRERDRHLETRLKCGRASYPANFTYLPDEQYSAVLYSESGDTVSKFMVGLLPKSPGVDGTFLLQYTLLLTEGGEKLAGGDGGLILAPGDGKHTAAAGKGCVFSAQALR